MILLSPEDVQRMLEVAKEFGGGFVAYWTHHVFHKVWHVTGRFKIIRRRRK